MPNSSDVSGRNGSKAKGPTTRRKRGALRGGLTERAYDHLKSLLITGALKSEEWFQIDEIAEELGTSRQPVMDALRRLSIEGFVDIVPQVGCRPRQPDITEIRDFFRFFSEGEALIAELAAKRAEPDDVLKLHLISAQIGALSEQSSNSSKQADLYRSLNRELHAEMRRIARSPTLAEVVEGLGDRSDFFIACHKDQVFSPSLKELHAEHEAIIAAIAKGNPKIARAAMQHHIDETERRLEITLD